MRRSTARRALISLAIAVPLAVQAQALPISGEAAQVAPGGLAPSDVQRLAQDARRRVIVVLRDQHAGLVARGATASNRLAALVADQAPLLNELNSLQAPGVHAFHVVNAIAATVSDAEAARLQSNPTVQAVVPDLLVHAPAVPRREQTGSSPAGATPAACSAAPLLEPEALQLTDTAFNNAAIPQAQSIVTGTGVTVAFIADGLDPTNPDFIRPNGTPVFADYQDFSGDGPNAPTGGAEAFLDASSIAAQGNQTYNVNAFVNAAHQRAQDCPQIKMRGVAPGASLMGLKAFNAVGESFTSALVQAIEYAVDHGANVVDESFGANPYPDNATDPISLANDAAVAAGVTVVASSGDAGSGHTLGSPATDPSVITVGATTQFQVYTETVAAGIQLGSGGYVDDNISALSSAGPSQSGTKTVDVVAPGDLGWALCSTNVAIYGACFDDNGNPSPIQVVGGTSESAPLTAGEAALVIQAYRQTHSGATPSPALVKTIVKSTANDLGIPSYEQGADLIDTYRAVLAALSYHDANGSPPRLGSALLVSPDTLAATAHPNTPQSFPIAVTNDGAATEIVRPRVQTLGAPTWHTSYTVPLDPATAPTFVDDLGAGRAYAEQDFTVPAGAQRLDVAISWNVVAQPATLVRLSLFDPQGRFVAYTQPQDAGAPETESGYGHVDVRVPAAGTWRAVVWTRGNSNGYSGPVRLDVSTANFVAAGSVTPAVQLLAPGQTATFVVATNTPAQPGDESASVTLNTVDTRGLPHASGAIPVVLRSLVALGPGGGLFGGMLSGGNGRPFAPGQTLSYQFDVPGGLHDLDLGVAITDTNYNLEGVLVDPNGLPLDKQSTVTALDPTTGLPTAYTNRLQIFRRDPQPGRWTFLLSVNDSTSGAQTALPFVAAIRFNGVSVQAAGVPNSPSVTLAAGAAVTATIMVRNTGIAAKDIFVDPRLAQNTLLSQGGMTTTIPLGATSPIPTFFVPPESSGLAIAAESLAPTMPINMDITNADGAPPYGTSFVSNPDSPDIAATPFVDPFTSQYAAVASEAAPEVPFGQWLAYPMPVGPFTGPATPTTIQLGAVAVTQQFDAAIDPSTGDEYALLTGQRSRPYAPLTLAPGASGTITLAITPSAPVGTVVHGVLYVDTLATSGGIPITNSGDEMVAIPYAYTVGPALSH